MEKDTKNRGCYHAPSLKLLPMRLEQLVCVSKTDAEVNAGLFEEEIWL